MHNQYPIEEIPLADIDLNRETQVRASIDEETIIRYFDVMVDEDARDKFPPVTLFQDENGKLWLADGHHRMMAALRRKFHSILAVVRPGTKEDAIWEAVSANSRNGLPLGRADVRRAVIMVLETFPNKSTTTIAEAVGCSQSYVMKVKGQVITSDNLTESAKVEGKDGKMYSSRRKRTTKKTSSEKTTSPKRDESAVEPSVEEQPPTPDVEAGSLFESDADDNRRIKMQACEERIFESIEVLERQINEWFDLAPSELHRDFDERLRKRIDAVIN